jgi:hypothetical protein
LCSGAESRDALQPWRARDVPERFLGGNGSLVPAREEGRGADGGRNHGEGASDLLVGDGRSCRTSRA